MKGGQYKIPIPPLALMYDFKKNFFRWVFLFFRQGATAICLSPFDPPYL